MLESEHGERSIEIAAVQSRCGVNDCWRLVHLLDVKKFDHLLIPVKSATLMSANFYSKSGLVSTITIPIVHFVRQPIVRG